ncbi:MAG: hypothetical protein JO297_02095 [Nitrososphaeraceae archaeon]|nr:hypothetical protein [Nitrososphaeraceae archaeon]
MTNFKPPSSSNTVYDILALIGLLLSLSAVITFALPQSSTAAAASSPIIMNGSDAHYNTSSSPEISYDTQNMTHRSAKAEWQPHRAQSAMSGEWWYLTALLHDASGKQYMLFTTIFKFDGKDTAIAKAMPKMAAMLGPSTTIISPQVELSNYNTGFHYSDSDIALVNPKQIWNSKTNTLSYKTPHYTGSWGFNGQNMTAVLKSQKMAYDLSMSGANQIMWAKDRTYNKEGFIQEGLPGNVSFYYSLPRLMVSGKLSYLDESGSNRTIDVAGQGWVDRQWGDFKTYAWEWASFRFDNGARLNLYSFENGYKVGTYQKQDGSLQWIDNFTIRQNGYDKAPNGQWVSLGWSYDFPTNVEGGMHYTVVPFSKNDWICSLSFCFIEAAGQLVNDTTGKQVGSSINESMDIRILKNGPYNVNQH